MLETSNFFFFHIFPCTFGEHSSILPKLQLSSSKSFSSEESKILSRGSKLNLHQTTKYLDWSKFKAFADDKMNGNTKLKYGLGRVKNI